LGYRVGLKADVWMLGCILYTLCFAKHPFQEGQKLSIINAQYGMPGKDENDRIGDKMKDIIRVMLSPNPEQRPSIGEAESLFNGFDSLEEVKLSDEVREIKAKQIELGNLRSQTKINKLEKKNVNPVSESNSSWH
jgi:AP2-associated kinase